MKFFLVNLALIAIGIHLASTASIKTNESYTIHAVLVAGSNTYDNYRHQANVCHAYQILRSHGVPAENIILMMYDDVVNAPENPFPGKLFNTPSGPDVYEGVIKDYTGDEVTPENFIKVLKGDKDLAASGKKVLTSGPNDHVFIYFTDHGATGLVGFPSSTLSSHDLVETLVFMHDNNLYGALTFYLEACESGSMLTNILPDNLNIYATTSTNPEEYGYATFCETPKFGTCLSDEYSTAWMGNSDFYDISKETLETQFKNVKQSVASSTPQEFGTLSIATLDVGQFQGETVNKTAINKKLIQPRDLVNSRDVPLFGLRKRLAAAYANNQSNVDQLQSQLATLVSGRQFYDRAIRRVISELCHSGFCSNTDQVLSTRLPLVDHKSYSSVVKIFESSCINVGIHTYGTKYMYTLANIVQSNNFDQLGLEQFTNRLMKACADHIVGHGFKSIV